MAFYLVIVYSIPSAITTVMMGASADVNGRKPVLLLSFVGQTLAIVPAIVSANDMSSSMLWLIASYILCGMLSILG
jgi:MFS family permease